ncbi:MAG: hypothetical protein JSR58_03820 [Verrucomicrobia bacterium]|nr:hypothetical protein [Verrucomicrobiota bacterium]
MQIIDKTAIMETTNRIKPLSSLSYVDRNGSELKVCDKHVRSVSNDENFNHALEKLHKYMGITPGTDYQISLTQRYVRMTALDSRGKIIAEVTFNKDEKETWTDKKGKIDIKATRQGKATQYINLIYERIKQQAEECRNHPSEKSKKNRNHDNKSLATRSSDSKGVRIQKVSDDEDDSEEELKKEKSTPSVNQKTDAKKTSAKSKKKTSDTQEEDLLATKPLPSRREEEEKQEIKDAQTRPAIGKATNKPSANFSENILSLFQPKKVQTPMPPPQTSSKSLDDIDEETPKPSTKETEKTKQTNSNTLQDNEFVDIPEGWDDFPLNSTNRNSSYTYESSSSTSDETERPSKKTDLEESSSSSNDAKKQVESKQDTSFLESFNRGLDLNSNHSQT